MTVKDVKQVKGVREQVEGMGWRMEDCRVVEGGNQGNGWWFPGFVGGLEIFFFLISLISSFRSIFSYEGADYAFCPSSFYSL